MTQQKCGVHSLAPCPFFDKGKFNATFKGDRRQRGRVVRVAHLKSGDFEFKFRSDHQLDLFQVVSGSLPLLRL